MSMFYCMCAVVKIQNVHGSFMMQGVSLKTKVKSVLGKLEK